MRIFHVRVFVVVALCVIAVAAPAWAQRQVLPEGAAPVRYDLAVDVDPARDEFTGEARITVDVAAALERVTLNAADMTITRAAIDGRNVVFALDEEAETLTLTPRRPLAAGRHVLTIAYRGRVMEDAYGLFRTEYDDAGVRRRMLVTQFEPGDARRFAPMWDEPARKAVFALTATLPEAMSAVSNMPVAETRVSRGREIVRFADSPVMSSYLLFLGVGDFERISTTVAGVDVGVITRRGESEKGRFALESAARLITYFNDYFGMAYPLPKLDMIAAPGAGGFAAMENWGAILYFDRFVLLDPALSSEADKIDVFNTVAHEIAHQWFGNIVTMSWWDDLWLNEGFASWMASKATEALHPEWSPWLLAAMDRDGALDTDSLTGTHPVVQQVNTIEEANLAFDAITYQKGQAVIRMIESYVGEDAFRDGIRAYMREHQYANTVTSDLWRALEGASHQPVSRVAPTFTDQMGAPLVRADSALCRRGRDVRVALTQERYAADEASRTGERWAIPLRLRIVGGGEDRAAVLDAAAGTLTAPGCGVAIVNAGQGGYARVLYAADDFTRLRGDFVRLSPDDQLGLLQDYVTHGYAGYAPLPLFLELARAVPADADPVVKLRTALLLDGLGALMRARESGPAYTAFALGVLRPWFDAVGWEARAGEAANDGVLRATLITVLGRMGDPAVSAEARRRALSSDPALMPGQLREAILRAAAARADAATYDALAARAAGARTFLEQEQFFRVLAETQDEALAGRTLALALDERAPRQLRALFVSRVARTHPDLAWDFLRANRAAIEGTLDPLRRLEFGPDIAAGLDDEARVAELEAYASGFPAEARDAVDAAIAGIGHNARVRTERLGAVDDWLRRPR